MSPTKDTTPTDDRTGDFYDFEAFLPDADRDVLTRVDATLAEHVAPIINDYWTRAAFPFEVIPHLAALGIAGQPYSGHGCAGRSTLMDGFTQMHIARVDPSIATFMGVHTGLAMGSIDICGSEEQKSRWLPPMARMELIGSFGLTEIAAGSGTSRGLVTTARREGDRWVLNGNKKWIGNATFADLNVIWARDEADDRVKGFVVAKDTPGFTTEALPDKIALRIVQNALITLDDVEVAEDDRLQKAESFKDVAKVLKMTRAGVSWMAVGCARGAYEHALAYSKEREQFGRPIAGFQLVQDLLVRMLANVTSSTAMCVRLSQLQDAGVMRDEHASLAKAFCTMRMRETVGWARELLGGNGILLEHNIGRFVADAEAIYSYEGTREINTLIVGKAITGHSAFV